MVLATEYTIKQTPLYELGPDLVLWVIGIFTCVGTNQPTYMLKAVRIESMRFEAVQFNAMFNLNFEMIGFEPRTSGVGSDRPTN